MKIALHKFYMKSSSSKEFNKFPKYKVQVMCQKLRPFGKCRNQLELDLKVFLEHVFHGIGFKLSGILH